MRNKTALIILMSTLPMLVCSSADAPKAETPRKQLTLRQLGLNHQVLKKFQLFWQAHIPAKDKKPFVKLQEPEEKKQSFSVAPSDDVYQIFLDKDRNISEGLKGIDPKRPPIKGELNYSF